MKLSLSLLNIKSTIFVLALMLIGEVGYGQLCDYATGNLTISTQGGNLTEDYANRFVVTDVRGDIISVSNTNIVSILQEGFYLVYVVNYRKTEVPEGIEPGKNIDNISNGCFDVSMPKPITVCENVERCNYCLGEEVSPNTSGGNNNSDYTTKYVYTNVAGVIVDILDEPFVERLDTGLYNFFAVNYETAAGITGLEIGERIYNLAGTCLDISATHIVSVCDQLKPRIFFDLRDCDILRTATIGVGGEYVTYEWNTGARTQFIDIDATRAFTYQVTVTLANGCIGFGTQVITGNEPASIGDFVWEDLNANGTQDPGEPGLNGVRVNLYTDFDRNGRPDIPGFPSCTTVTSNDPETGLPGYYNFNVYRSNYVVEFVLPGGYKFTQRNATTDVERDSDADPETGLTRSIGVIEGERRRDVDAGVTSSASICGRVWRDIDADGRRDDDDPGVNDIIISLVRADGTIQATTTTSTDAGGVDGRYCFDSIPAITYYLRVTTPDGVISTLPKATPDPTRDSDATNGNGPNTTNLILLRSGDQLDHIDFGIYQGGTICGLVFRDEEGGREAIYDEGIDSLIPFVWVQLLDSRTEFIVKQTGTNIDGRYCISGIPIGSYTVKFPSVGGMSLVTALQGDNPLIDSDADPNTLKTRVLFVSPVDTIYGINAGLRLGTVPVELVFFDGFWDRNKDVNNLKWQTASEINNKHFELQRAYGNNGSFKTITTIRGKGTTLRTTNYEYEDADIAASGTYYYRLKQVDYDGGYEYSRIKPIDVFRTKSNIEPALTLGINPNPASDYITARVKVQGKELSKAELWDSAGKIVRTWPLMKQSNGVLEIEVSVADVPAGSYLFVISSDDEFIKEAIQIIR